MSFFRISTLLIACSCLTFVSHYLFAKDNQNSGFLGNSSGNIANNNNAHSGDNMERLKKVETEQAPKAIGPYSQAILAGDFLFVSGQIPVDPQTNQLVENTIEAQTIQVLANIEAILKAQGLNFDSVVKTEVYLKDMNDFKAMNNIYAQKFSHSIKPARQTLQVAKLPLDVLVEISCIAYAKK